MTGILLCCAALILAIGGLYLVLCCPALVASWWYRIRCDPEAFATVPDPLDEHFKTAPTVVAGQDIDDNKLIAELQQAYADYRAGRDIFAGAPREI